uniref:Transposase Tc1-like domain-containing protein n=1 Tax=Esox lucius TaxID=8010 RepID=A0AAY5KXH6_ESOLU
MGSRKELSKDLHSKVTELYKDGKGYKKISKAFQIPVSTVQSLMKKCKIRESLDTKPRSGRPRKISAKTARRIVWDTKKNPQVTSGEKDSALEKNGVVISRSTIRRYVNKNELHGRVARKKSLLHQCHKKAWFHMPNNPLTRLTASVTT